MEKSVEEDAVVVVGGNGGSISQSEKRAPRRRLVQSTLFPHRAQLNDQAEDEDEEVEEEYYGSRKKKGKRKGKPKTTPPRKVPNNDKEALGSEAENGNSMVSLSRRSPPQLKEKQHKDASPCEYQSPSKLKRPYCRKTMLNHSSDTLKNVVQQSDHTPESVFDLRLEAKLAAEENARIFTGKQTHPFFSSWKVGKKFQGTSVVTELENKQCSIIPESESIVFHPVHIFEMMQDDYVSLDWSNWIFCDESSLSSTSSRKNISSSAFEDFIEPLKFENCPSISNFVGDSFLQNEVLLNHSPSWVEDADPSLEAISSANGQASQHVVEDLKHHQRYLVYNLEQSRERFLQGRMTPYYCVCGDQLESSLWTNKYQPKKSSEVCGNNESVRFLNEWLGSWREKYSGIRKNSRCGHHDNVEDTDYSLDESGSDTKSIDGTSFNNVLLITGPVGSGKSAAIYACANEQGFEVIEVSASDWRNGAHVKQKFGAGLESWGLNKWSLVGPANSGRKHGLDFLQTQLGNSVQEFEDVVVELISETCKEDLDTAKLGSVNIIAKDSINGCKGADKTLILFEDVDTIFEEDRGFITSIQKMAETAKWPMILTSNSKDPVLPDQLNKLKLCFISPTPEELFFLLYMVCTTEKANIESQLLEQFIRCCQGDIRKSLLLLQFWCQGKWNDEDRKLQSAFGPLAFDLDLGHWALPNVFPWDFPCQLSELVEKEITKALSGGKENPSLLDVVKEDELSDKETQDALTMDVERKKEAMLDLNLSIHDGNAFSTQFDCAADLSNSSGSPVAFTWRSAKRRSSIVLSSCSQDEFCSDNSLVDLNILSSDTRNEVFLDSSGTLQEDLYNCSQREGNQHLYDTYKSVDVSCVPESSFVPETEINNGVEFPSKNLSCGHCPFITDDPSCATSIQSLPYAKNVDETVPGPVKYSQTTLESMYNVDSELSHGDEEVGDSQNGHLTVIRGYQVMDECSRADFNRTSISGQNPRCSLPPGTSVQKTWNNLRSHHANLKLHVTSEGRNASEFLKLASGMTDLISVADLLFGCCPPLESESPVVHCMEPDAFYCYDEQLKMASTIVEHGFCYFAKESASRESNLGFKNRVDLDQEMLASTTNTKVQRKLVAPDTSMISLKCAKLGSEIRSPRTDVSLKREVEVQLYSMIQNVVQPKLFLALKGPAFHEYVSSLGHISKLEASRVSQSIDNTKQRRRRTRAAHHYLITGPLTLLPEDVSFLAQHSCFGKAPLEMTKASYR